MHWLQPEDEERDCEFCRRYEHYSFRNPAPEKRGQPIVELGQYRKRGRGDVPQCDMCPRVFAWTEENRALYVRWRMWLLGVRPGPLDAASAWAFFRLEEAARQITGESAAGEVRRAVVEAFCG